MTYGILSFCSPKTTPITWSLASCIISKERLQLGGWLMGAVMRVSLTLWNAWRHSLVKTYGISLAKSKLRCLAILRNLDKITVETRMSKEASHPFHTSRGGDRFITSIFALLTSMTLCEITWTKTTPSCTIEWHFSQFNTRLTSSYLQSTLLRFSKHNS